MSGTTETRNITFAVDYTTERGKAYKGGETYKVNSPLARLLINIGKARLAEDAEPTNDSPASDAVTGTPAADATPPAPTTTGKGK